jgi:hypothetical protein
MKMIEDRVTDAMKGVHITSPNILLPYYYSHIMTDILLVTHADEDDRGPCDGRHEGRALPYYYSHITTPILLLPYYD